MKAFRVYIIIASVIFSSSAVTAQTSSNNNFYLGVGTGISSYLGGYFGNAYYMKVFSGYSDDYYDNNYYYDSYDYTTIWSPVQIDITGGFNLNEFLSLEFNSTFLWSFNGYLDPQFVTGSTANRDYIDKNSRSLLYSVPVSAALKIHSTDEYGSGFYFKAGPAFQYTSEEYDRIREYYSYEKYYSYSSYAYLYTVSKSEWLPGFTASMGLQLDMSDGLTSVTELSYSYFKISGNGKTALALDRAIEAQLFSLNTKVYFSF